jgi:hypothetical protein
VAATGDCFRAPRVPGLRCTPPTAPGASRGSGSVSILSCAADCDGTADASRRPVPLSSTASRSELKAVHKGFPEGLSSPAIVKGGLDLLVRQAFEHQADHAQEIQASLEVAGIHNLCSSGGCARSARLSVRGPSHNTFWTICVTHWVVPFGWSIPATTRRSGYAALAGFSGRWDGLLLEAPVSMATHSAQLIRKLGSLVAGSGQDGTVAVAYCTRYRIESGSRVAVWADARETSEKSSAIWVTHSSQVR